MRCVCVCRMADQLDLKLVLEANVVKDAGQICQQLYEHGGVRTLEQFASLRKETLREWGIDDYYVCDSALCHAQELMTISAQDLPSIKQNLLVRARMHVCTTLTE